MCLLFRHILLHFYNVLLLFALSFTKLTVICIFTLFHTLFTLFATQLLQISHIYTQFYMHIGYHLLV